MKIKDLIRELNEFDDEYVLTNYQYIQVLDLTKEDIAGLVSYTTDLIKNICSGLLHS